MLSPGVWNARISGKSRWRLLAACLCASLTCIATSSRAQEPAVESQSQTVQIVVTVEPVEADPRNALTVPPGQKIRVLQGMSVRIRGVAAPALAGKQLRVVVTPPQGPEIPDPNNPEPPEEAGPESKLPVDIKEPAELIGGGQLRPTPPTTLLVTAAPDGSYSTQYATVSPGDHDVEVSDAGEQGRGYASFEVESQNEFAESLRKKLKKDAEALVKNVRTVLREVRLKTEVIPDSPARTDLIEQTKNLENVLEEFYGRREPEWLRVVPHLGRLNVLGPALRKVADELMNELLEWQKLAADINATAESEATRLRQMEVVCDRLDALAGSIAIIEKALLHLEAPAKSSEAWAARHSSEKLTGLLTPAQRARGGAAAVKTAWGGVRGPHSMNARAQQLAAALRIAIANNAFATYCEKFEGPMSGTMSADFFSAAGQKWWKYSFGITGNVVLRYPKNAKGSSIPLSGEFVGKATTFKSVDNAIPVLYPGLAKGTVFKQIYRNEPQAGQAFRVPIRGTLNGDTLRLELQTAAADFEGAVVKVRMALLPVLSMRIQVEDYELPYKGAHHLLLRSMDNGPLELKVQRAGKMMLIERKLQSQRKAATAHGYYDVSLKACNPGCGSTGQPGASPTKL